MQLLNYKHIFLALFCICCFACTKLGSSGSDTSSTDNSSNSTSTGPSTSTSNPQNPSATPATISTDTNKTSTTTKDTITLTNLAITFTQFPPCAPDQEKFIFGCTASKPSIPADATYEWYFGDGENDTLSANPLKVYTNANAYTVLVKVKYKNQYIGTATKKITAYGTTASYEPKAAITAYAPNSPVNGTYTYTFYGTGSKANTNGSLTYFWKFGDDKTGSGSFITHDYTQATVQQLYHVTLRVTNSLGCKDSITQPIQVPGR